MITWLLLTGMAFAAEPEVEATVHGDVKSFFFGVFPYQHPFMPPDPVAQGILDLRLKLDVHFGDIARLEVHHSVTAISAGEVSGGVFQTGVVGEFPEAVDLSWDAVEEGTMTLGGRTDRLVLTTHLGPVDVAVGRQPISFGSASMFTPLDLVGPFNPAVVDQEYKPGYDAVRADAYFGMAGKVTVVGAYAGGWDREGLVAAAWGQGTIGVTDLGLLLGEVRADHVVGASLSTSIGPIGVYADAAVTVPEEEDTFVRAVVGALWRPAEDSTLYGEAYLQTLGAGNPDDYLAFALSDRFANGELWLMGRGYLGLAWSQQLQPTLTASVAAVINLGDGSALVPLTLGWSVAGNAEVAAGAYFGLGGRPEDFSLQSEFGLYPITAFLQTKAYF